MGNNFRSKGDVASSLSRITGTDFEGAYHKLNSYNAPKIINKLTGNVDVKSFSNVATASGASRSRAINEAVRLTGSSYESVLIKMSMPKF
jgi:hypothetical protein